MKKYSELNKDRIELFKAIPLAKPFTILLEPTNICNFRCSFCFHNNNKFRSMEKGLMKWGTFQKIVDDLSWWGGDKIKVIRIIGFGEPTLCPRLGEMVEYIKKLAIADRVEMTSNCSLLSSELSKKLVQVELDYLRVSVYPEMHRPRLWPITKKLYKLRQLRGVREKPFIYIKMLDRGEMQENQRFFDTYANLADEIALESPHSWLDGATSSTSICPQPFKMLSIRYNGDVIVCDPDWENHTKVGNALETNIKDIWNGEPLRKFWDMQLEHRRSENASCKVCSFVDNEFYVKDKL